MKHLKNFESMMDKSRIVKENCDSCGCDCDECECENCTCGSDSMNESTTLTDPIFLAGASTLAALGGTFLVSLIKDLKSAKSKEERKKILKSIASVINKRAGN